MEIIAQNLLNMDESEILVFSTYDNFNVRSFFDICMSYFEDKTERETVLDKMNRLRIIDIISDTDFNDFMSCLEALILGLPKVSLIIVDSISFYHHDAFVFEKLYNKPLTIQMYLNHFQNIFSNIVNQHNVTIIYTIPENLVAEYAKNARTMIECEEEERKIYAHIKSKTEHKFNDKFSLSEKDELYDTKLCDDEHEKFIPVPEKKRELNKLETDSSPLIEGINSIELKELSKKQSSEIDEFVSPLVPSEADSFSDTSSTKSNEGYKSDCGTEESNSANERLPEKFINNLYREMKPDVSIKLLNITANSYIMQVRKDGEEFDINFDITDNGLEWDDIPAERH